MNELSIKDTFTSLELVEMINSIRRKEKNRVELRHDILLEIIRDEFSEEISLQNILESDYKNERGKKYPMFILTLSQARQVLLRESKFVRRKIIKYIEDLEDTLKKKMIEEAVGQKLLGFQELKKRVEDLEFQNGNGKNLKAIVNVGWLREHFYLDKNGIVPLLVKRLVMLSNENQIPYDSIYNNVFTGEVYVFHTVIYDIFKKQILADEEYKILPSYRKILFRGCHGKED